MTLMNSFTLLWTSTPVNKVSDVLYECLIFLNKINIDNITETWNKTTTIFEYISVILS